MTFGKRLKQARMHVGISQGELTKRTKSSNLKTINRVVISKFENENKHYLNPTLETMLSLANGLGVSLSTLTLGVE